MRNFIEQTSDGGVQEDQAAAWREAAPGTRAEFIPRGLEEIWHACGAFEWLSLAYMAWMNVALLIFHRNIAQPGLYIVLHCWAALAIVCLAWAAAHSKSKIVQFVRHWYPLALYLFFFEELGRLVHLIFPGWFDRWLIDFDYRFAGVHPAVWLAQFSHPALNDFMQFAYMTYFLYLVILPAILYAAKDRLAFWTVMTSTAAANYLIYVVAVLFPIESPHFSLPVLESKPLAGGAFTAMINFIERFGRVHGGAFPSAHVAGSMVALLGAWRYRQWLFWVCLPFFICMCVATVYGRYHYVADVIAGIVVGAAGFSAGTRLMARHGALPEIAE
ncbi:MAG TPA: phosphatase PAP2 family protein [Candidatus Limnocylindrales bacterium]|nr:phosphatase PAP2 family protein [Candidatus Limnocylindrales bacterium]